MYTYTIIVDGYLPSGHASFEGVFGNSQLKLTPGYWFDWVVASSKITKDYRIENNGELTTDISVMVSGEITDFTSFDETDLSIAPWGYIDIKATQNIPEDAPPGLYEGWVDVFDESIGMSISSNQYTYLFVEKDLALMDGMANFGGSTKDWGQSIYHFDVTEGNTELNAEVNWDNVRNDMDLYLVDPNGKLADYSIAWRSTREEVSVKDPIPGKWMLYVEGFRIREEPQAFTGGINVLKMLVPSDQETGIYTGDVVVSGIGEKKIPVTVYVVERVEFTDDSCSILSDIGKGEYKLYRFTDTSRVRVQRAFWLHIGQKRVRISYI
jgi:hypothetical protein